jgi:hypothetical protein
MELALGVPDLELEVVGVPEVVTELPKRWTFGAEGAVGVYTFGGDEAKRWIGCRGGLVAAYGLNEKWKVEGQLGYWVRRSSL